MNLPESTFTSTLVETKKSTIPNAGTGLFVKDSVKKNTKLCDYFGRELTYREFKISYPNGIDKYFYKGRNIFYLLADEEPYLSQSAINYINESTPNCILKKRSLYSTKDLTVGEELFLSYPKYYKRTWSDPNRSYSLNVKE